MKNKLKTTKTIFAILCIIGIVMWLLLLVDTYKDPLTNCRLMRERVVDNSKMLCQLALGKWMKKGIYNYPDGGQSTVNKEYCKTRYIFKGMMCNWIF